MRAALRTKMMFCALTIVPAHVLAGGAGSGQGQISDEGATYTFLGFNNSGPADWRPGDPVSGDQLFSSWWWFRAEGEGVDDFERSFGNGTPDMSSFEGNTATFMGQEEDLGLDWTITWQVDGRRNALDSTIEIFNATDDPVVLNVFHYADVDLNGSLGDIGTFVGNDTISFTDVGTPGVEILYAGPGSDAYQIQVRSTLLDDLNDDQPTDLSSDVFVDGPADVTGGFQWVDVVIPARGEASFDIGFRVIPSPGVGAALMFGACAHAARRRR